MFLSVCLSECLMSAHGTTQWVETVEEALPLRWVELPG